MAYSSTKNQGLVQFDAKGNTVLPNGLRVLGLQSVGFVKTDANGTFYIDTSGGGGGGSGTVTSVSVVTANGFAGTAATASSTPAITISTVVTGILKGNGTAVSAATASDITTLIGSTTYAVYNASGYLPLSGGTLTGSLTAPSFVKSGGTSSQLLAADGSVITAGTGITVSAGTINASGTGGGTVTIVSVVSANGFAGTVATASSTPAITLSTTVTGILKGNGTAISAAAAGTDYVVPSSLYTDYDSTIVGLRNSSNKVFTTTYNFISGSTKVYVNGLRYTPGASYDYQETAVNQITFTNAPDAGDLIVVDYIKQ